MCNKLLGIPSVTSLVVPFVACGDLTNTGFDSDKSYPLEMNSVAIQLPGTMKAAAAASALPPNPEACSNATSSDGYTYIKPIQPPIKPNYYTYLQEHAAK